VPEKTTSAVCITSKVSESKALLSHTLAGFR